MPTHFEQKKQQPLILEGLLPSAFQSRDKAQSTPTLILPNSHIHTCTAELSRTPQHWVSLDGWLTDKPRLRSTNGALGWAYTHTHTHTQRRSQRCHLYGHKKSLPTANNKTRFIKLMCLSLFFFLLKEWEIRKETEGVYSAGQRERERRRR